MAVWAARLDLSCVALYLVSGGESLVEAGSNLKLECLITLEKWKGQNRTGMTKSIEHLDRVQASVLTVISLFLLLEASTFNCSCKKIFARYSVVFLCFSPFPPSPFLLLLFLLFFAFSLFFCLLHLSCCLLSYLWKLRIPSPLPSPGHIQAGMCLWVGIRISEGIQDDTARDIHDGPLSQQPNPRCMGTLVTLSHIPVPDFIYGHTRRFCTSKHFDMRIWCINMQAERNINRIN